MLNNIIDQQLHCQGHLMTLGVSMCLLISWHQFVQQCYEVYAYVTQRSMQCRFFIRQKPMATIWEDLKGDFCIILMSQISLMMTIINSSIQTKVMGNLSTSIHVFCHCHHTSLHYPYGYFWQWVHFNWTLCGNQSWAQLSTIVLYRVSHFSFFSKTKGTFVQSIGSYQLIHFSVT